MWVSTQADRERRGEGEWETLCHLLTNTLSIDSPRGDTVWGKGSFNHILLTHRVDFGLGSGLLDNSVDVFVCLLCSVGIAMCEHNVPRIPNSSIDYFCLFSSSTLFKINIHTPLSLLELHFMALIEMTVILMTEYIYLIVCLTSNKQVKTKLCTLLHMSHYTHGTLNTTNI